MYVRRSVTLVNWIHRVLVVLALASLTTTSLNAHPHAWIDLRSTVGLNDEGQIVGIEQQWLFDDFYSVFVMDGADSTAESQKEALRKLAQSNLKNLREYNYFTDVKSGDRKIALGTVSEYESEVRDGRLWMKFIVPFLAPVDASVRPFSFSVYDPTYYIEIAHLEGDLVGFRGPKSNVCSAQIIQPSPTVDMVMLAQALDKDATPDNTFGKMFAERVTVRC
jgi:ABC-type uncharacterized transport system substrate-binding protein